MNLETLSIEQLAELRDRVNSLPAERISAGQKEISGEAERLDTLVGQPHVHDARERH